MDKNPKPKKTITDKQKAASLVNLEKGRKKRMETLKQKQKTEKEEKEYDLSSEEENAVSESDDEPAFILSKKPPKVPEKKKEVKKPVNDETEKLKGEFEELKNMMFQLASYQKKQNKKMKNQKENHQVQNLL